MEEEVGCNLAHPMPAPLFPPSPGIFRALSKLAFLAVPSLDGDWTRHLSFPNFRSIQNPYEKGKLLRASPSSSFCRERESASFFPTPKNLRKNKELRKKIWRGLSFLRPRCVFLWETKVFVSCFFSPQQSRQEAKWDVELACLYRQRWKDKIGKGGAKKSIEQLCKRLWDQTKGAVLL